MDSVDGFMSLIPKEEDEVALVIKSLSRWHCCPRCILRFLGEKDHFSYRKSNEELSEWLLGYQKDRNGMGTSVSENVKCSDEVESIEIQAAAGGPANDADKSNTDSDAQIKEGVPSKDETTAQNTSTTTTADISANGQSITMVTQEVECSDQDADMVIDMPPVCVSCLGVLQEKYCSEAFCHELHAIIQQEDYEFDTYYLSLSIPVPLMVRENALFVKLKELLPEVYDESERDEITPIKEAWKWANGPTMSSLLKVPFDQKSLFEVKLNFSHPELDKECNFFFDLYPEVFCKRKNNKHGWEVFTRVNVPKALEDMGDVKFKRNYSCPPKPQALPCDCSPITCCHEAIYVAGRYNKYSRHLSQTPWVVEGERRTDSSVEEMICVHLKEAILAKEYKLSASGREDVDVLMLGRGRPFVVEMINPRRIRFTKERMRELQDKINATHEEIRVRDLQVVSKDDTSNLKKGEEEKVKIYSAKCWTNKPITQENMDSVLNALKDLVIKQKTPIRVLHRRSLAVRERVIHTISAKVEAGGSHFDLFLSTQAGTYIKEFVHGDFGRTRPCLGTLLDAECDILELNVDAVELDWPQQLEDLDT